MCWPLKKDECANFECHHGGKCLLGEDAKPTCQCYQAWGGDRCTELLTPVTTEPSVSEDEQLWLDHASHNAAKVNMTTFSHIVKYLWVELLYLSDISNFMKPLFILFFLSDSLNWQLYLYIRSIHAFPSQTKDKTNLLSNRANFKFFFISNGNYPYRSALSRTIELSPPNCGYIYWRETNTFRKRQKQSNRATVHSRK